MPIKNRTDGSRQPRLPVFGDIRKGSPQNEKGHVGKDLDHFRITWRPGYEHLEAEFNLYHTDYDVKHINNLALMGKTVDECFDSWLDFYAKRKLVGRSDGENILMLWDNETNQWDRNPRPYNESDWLDNRGRAKFQSVGYIHFLPIELIQRTGELGTLLWRITSDHEIDRVYNVLSTIQQLVGYLSDPLRWELTRHNEDIVVPTDDGRIVQTRSLVRLRPSNLHTLHIKSQPQLTGENTYDEDGVLLESGDTTSDTDDPFNDVMPVDADVFLRFVKWCQKTFGDEMTDKDVKGAIEKAFPETLGFINKVGELGFTRGDAMGAIIAYTMDYKMDKWASFARAYPEYATLEDTVLSICEDNLRRQTT